MVVWKKRVHFCEAEAAGLWGHTQHKGALPYNNSSPSSASGGTLVPLVVVITLEINSALADFFHILEGENMPLRPPSMADENANESTSFRLFLLFSTILTASMLNV
jgi:hypothetical protein